MKQVGEWRPGAGVNVTDTAAFFEPGSANVTLLVITILVSPIHSLSIPLRYVIHPYVESREGNLGSRSYLADTSSRLPFDHDFAFGEKLGVETQ